MTIPGTSFTVKDVPRSFSLRDVAPSLTPDSRAEIEIPRDVDQALILMTPEVSRLLPISIPRSCKAKRLNGRMFRSGEL
jgi:hypothetical protein